MKKIRSQKGYAILLIIILVSIIGLYVVLSEEEREDLGFPNIEFDVRD